MSSSPPASICVVRISAIGDTCHALAVVRRLQDNWPEADITWIIGTTEASLLGGVDGVEFITFDKSAGLTAYRDVAGRLASKRFDVVLCMHASLRVNLLYPRLRSPLKVGFDRPRARDFQWLFTNRRVAPTDGRHAMEAMMSFADAIGAAETPLRWDLPIADEDRRFAAGYADGHRELVVVSPCSSERARNFRNWPAACFADICRELVETRGCRVVLTGGRSRTEAEYGERIASTCTVDNLIGRTTLKQLAALLGAARLVICPDSGPAHIATALGTPVLGLYAGSNPGRTGPYRSRELTVDRYPEAARRFLSADAETLAWGQRIRDPRVMEMITIDDVRSKISRFFDQKT